MTRMGIGLVGTGRIAREQHIPVISKSPDFKLTACTSLRDDIEGIDCYRTVEEMLTDHPEIEAVAVASATNSHYAIAKAALMAGKHVLIEKPPCATNAEFDRLIALACRAKRTLFQTWHLRYAPRVIDARKWLKTRPVIGGKIAWRENVHDCHPGQTWIWQRGGFGVFDPGINAISVLIQVLPDPIFVETAELFYPANCECPIAADITFRTDAGVRLEAAMDFNYPGKPDWNIRLDTKDGRLALTGAAPQLFIDDQRQSLPESPDGVHAEYAALYRRFADLIVNGETEADAAPLRLVSDIFVLAKHTTVAPFAG